MLFTREMFYGMIARRLLEIFLVLAVPGVVAVGVAHALEGNTGVFFGGLVFGLAWRPWAAWLHAKLWPGLA